MTTRRAATHRTPQMTEWAAYLALIERGAGPSELLAAARAIVDAGNRETALRHLGAKPAARRKAAESGSLYRVSAAEIARHCQFPAAPSRSR